MMKKKSFGYIWPALKDSFKGFSNDKVTKLSASLAYYTIFSLGPMLIVIIYLCSIFMGGSQSAQDNIYNQIKSFIGAEGAEQIQTIIRSAAISGKGTLAATIGIITLLIGATTVFGEIQDSINSIWGIKPKPKLGIMKLIKNRLLSFGLIASLGFLLLVSLGVTAVVEAIGGRLEAIFPDVTVIVIYIINLLLTLVITTVLFGVIFKVLPDIRINYKDIWPGAIATSLLFLIGKFLISLYIAKSDVGSTYGAAGSLVVLLLWIYYSSIILYFGAEFTKAFALRKGVKIVPSEYAVWADTQTVAGAKFKDEERRETDNQQSGIPVARQLTPGAALVSSPEGEKAARGKSGFSTVAIGLVLYFFLSSRKGAAR